MDVPYITGFFYYPPYLKVFRLKQRLTIIVLSIVIPCVLFARNYTEDSLAVRAILDSNEQFHFTVERATETSEGRIVKLDLWESRIRVIPSDIGKLTALTYLNLADNNDIESLPPEIKMLTELTYFNLGSCKLESLPPEFGALINLKSLWLHSNNLRKLPSEIGNLVNCEQLCLNCNNLASLPPEIGNLTQMNCLGRTKCGNDNLVLDKYSLKEHK